MAASQPQLTSGQNSAYLSILPYSQPRVSEPSRVTVPPPDLHHEGGEVSFTPSYRPFDYGSAEYGTPAFLHQLAACAAQKIHHSVSTWNYEKRRTAQLILPFLLLGPNQAAQDAAYVRDSGITLLISVRSGLSARRQPQYLDPSKMAAMHGISSLTLDLDTPYDLITKLPQTIKAMNDHLEQSCHVSRVTDAKEIGAKILVYCESGNERSTTLVVAYLMVLYGVDVITAIQIVQAQRFSVAPEDGMKNMLSNFEDILRAKRDVATGNASLQQGNLENRAPPAVSRSLHRTSVKRNIDRAYESDDEIDDEGDGSTISILPDRRNHAPFTDRSNR